MSINSFPHPEPHCHFQWLMLATSLGCLNPTEASLPRTCLCCSQLSRLIHQRWGRNGVSRDMRSWPTACQTLVTALDLVLESGKDYVLPKRRYENWSSWSMLPKQGCSARHYSMEKFSLLPTGEDQLSIKADRWEARTHLLPTRLLKNRSKRTIWFFFSSKG